MCGRKEKESEFFMKNTTIELHTTGKLNEKKRRRKKISKKEN
jgi:hypothetical protein